MKHLLLIVFFSFFSSLVKASPQSDVNNPTDIESELNFYWDQYEFYRNSEFDSASYFLKMIKSKAELGNKQDWVAAAYSALADVSYDKGYLGEAMYNYLVAAKKFEEIGALSELANVYNSIGDVYVLAKDYNLAVYYFLQAKDIFYYNNNNKGVAMVCRNLAISYTEQKSFADAEAALVTGKAAAIKARDFYMLSMIYNTLGVLNFQRKAYDSARDNYNKAIQFSDSLQGELRAKSAAINNIGEAYLYEGNYEEAEKWLNEAQALKSEIGDPSFTQSTINLLGRLYIEQGQYVRAVSVLESGLKDEDLLFVDIELGKGLMLIVEALVKANAEADKSKEAYLNKQFATYSQKLIIYNSHLLNLREELETIGKQQVVRLAVEKHSMNAKLGAAEEKNEKFKYAIIIPVFLLICAMISVYLSLRRNARYKKLYAGIEEVLGNRALRKPNNK